MKSHISLLFIVLLWACNYSDHKPNSVAIIADPAKQNSVFNSLIDLTNKSIPANQLNDSLSFLVLPVKLSCPACRKKTIDSIVKHQHDLAQRHFIIISGSEGRKNMNSYFQEVDKELPVIENQLFLDSTHEAYKKELVTENPVIYYTAGKKAYKKVSSVPATVKDDLREFFSGTRNTNHSE